MEPSASPSLSLIVAATDFSAGSGHALRRAATLAARTGAVLHLLYVESPMGGDYPPEHVSKGPAEALRAWGDDALAEVPHPARLEHVEAFVLRDLVPAEGILRHVAEHEASLLVIGTHGRRGLRRLLLGSVAEELIRCSPVPVLTVPYRCATWASADMSVLAPVDFSAHTREAIAWARWLAHHYDAPLDLLHIVPEAGPFSTHHPAPRPQPNGSSYDLKPDLDARARIQLERFFAESDGPEVDVRFHVRAGTPGPEIVRFIGTHPTGAVVMDTHGRQGIEHFLLGSTTEKTVRQLTCPALTVRPAVSAGPATSRVASPADLTGSPIS